MAYSSESQLKSNENTTESVFGDIVLNFEIDLNNNFNFLFCVKDYTDFSSTKTINIGGIPLTAGFDSSNGNYALYIINDDSLVSPNRTMIFKGSPFNIIQESDGKRYLYGKNASCGSCNNTYNFAQKSSIYQGFPLGIDSCDTLVVANSPYSIVSVQSYEEFIFGSAKLTAGQVGSSWYMIVRIDEL